MNTESPRRTLARCFRASGFFTPSHVVRPSRTSDSKEYAEGSMKHVLQYSDEPLVSMDLKGNPYSSIFSAVDTIGLGNFVKVVSWYDNEWGYSCRVADLLKFLADKGF